LSQKGSGRVLARLKRGGIVPRTKSLRRRHKMEKRACLLGGKPDRGAVAKNPNRTTAGQFLERQDQGEKTKNGLCAKRK